MAATTHYLIKALSPCIISCKLDKDYGHYYTVQKEVWDEIVLVNEWDKLLVNALRKMERICIMERMRVKEFNGEIIYIPPDADIPNQ